jgi:hypothetical protein
MATPEPGTLFLYGIPAEDAPVRSAEMRGNFEGLARTHYTTDAALPLAPRQGQQRIWEDVAAGNVRLQYYDGAAWLTLLQLIASGVPAPRRLLFSITTPMAVWTLDHNLGQQPLAQVFNTAWRQLQASPTGPGAGQYLLDHPTPNRIVVTHPAPATGFAIIVG